MMRKSSRIEFEAVFLGLPGNGVVVSVEAGASRHEAAVGPLFAPVRK